MGPGLGRKGGVCIYLGGARSFHYKLRAWERAPGPGNPEVGEGELSLSSLDVALCHLSGSTLFT